MGAKINRSFSDHCVFVMQSRIKLVCETDKFDKIDSLIYCLLS